MGQIISAKCNNCSLNAKYYLGYGWQDKELPGPRTLGYCGKCNEINVFYDKPICECGNKLEVLLDSNSIPNLPQYVTCPLCNGELSLQMEGLWD